MKSKIIRIQIKIKVFLSFVIWVVNHLVPKNKNCIIFYSEPDYTDNSRALYEEMIRLEYNKKYKIVWAIKNDLNKPKAPENVFFVKQHSLMGLWYFLRSKFIFTTHSFWVNKYVKEKQIMINLWHGMPIKRIGLLEPKIKKYSLKSDFMPATSEFYRIVMSKCFGIPIDNIFNFGLPRNDELFKGKKVLEKMDFKCKFSKMIIWMPTFRKATGRSMDGKTGELGIPILSRHNIIELDEYLSKLNILLLLKLHPYQQENTKRYFAKCTNIISIGNDDIPDGYSLYNLIGCSDGLLTDYSSVYIDYLSLNRPIGFIYDDIEEYEKSRGFIIDDILDFMPGEHIVSIDMLFKYFKDVHDGLDNFIERRLEINSFFNKYSDDKNSLRLISYLQDRYNF